MVSLKQLEHFNLYSDLQNRKNIVTRSLVPYSAFVNLIANAEYIITDEGSVQEECYYLNKLCLIMRSKTERKEGLGQNAVLGKFD